MNDSPTLLPRIRRTLNRPERRIDLQVDTGDGWRVADKPGGATGAFPIPPAFSTAFELARYDKLGFGGRSHGAAGMPAAARH